MTKVFHTNDVVKVNPSRGYGDSAATVISATEREATIRFSDGNVTTLYHAHLYQDSDCRRATVAARVRQNALNDAIGANKKRKRG